MDLIIPAAGKSSRFPGMRPKWLLTHPDGSIMLTAALRGLPLSSFDRVIVTILREHVERYEPVEGIREAYAELQAELDIEPILVHIIDESSSQPDTVAQTLTALDIDGPFVIKDVDNYFECERFDGNSIATFDINDLDEVDAKSKSYISLDSGGLIDNIVEKHVISPRFCCGAYSFESADKFLEAYDKMKDHEGLYVSHVIFQMMADGEIFSHVEVSEYIDWGTEKAWNKYKRGFATLFLDIDGVLVQNSGKYFSPRWGTTTALLENAEAIRELYDSGKVEIILTTSRSEEARELTQRQLESYGIKYHRLICGLQHSRRIVVNDYSPTNPYPSCSAVNIVRNSTTELRAMLKSIIGDN
jgi:hypothetical protein